MLGLQQWQQHPHHPAWARLRLYQMALVA